MLKSKETIAKVAQIILLQMIALVMTAIGMTTANLQSVNQASLLDPSTVLAPSAPTSQVLAQEPPTPSRPNNRFQQLSSRPKCQTPHSLSSARPTAVSALRLHTLPSLFREPTEHSQFQERSLSTKRSTSLREKELQRNQRASQ